MTQTQVDRHDPAFARPSKPIGQFYTREEAEDRARVKKWTMIEDAGRGWRRVVASPKPMRIIGSEVVKHLVKEGYVVIAAGGGGIPVVADEQGNLSGAAAVIDKDLASAVLAEAISADVLVIATTVEKVCLNYGKPDEQALDLMTAADARRFVKEGHFQAVSMLPKIQARLQFIERGRREALLTSPGALSAALAHKTGTRIVH